MKHINIIFTLFVITFLSIGFTGCEDEDTYTKEPDLFQPRFVLTEASEETNSLTLVWYEVKDADSYTIELHLDNYYKSLFASYRPMSHTCFWMIFHILPDTISV